MKKSEEELLLRIALLEAIIDSLPFEVWYKDVDGNYLVVNKNLEEYFGKSKEEIEGKDNFALYPPEAAAAFAESDRDAMNGGELQFFELDFDENVYEEYKRPVFDNSGKLVGITGYSRNITQRKKAIEELVERERNKSILLANAPGVAFRCANDAAYTVTYISDSCYELTGYTSEELLSGKPYYNNLIDPEFRKALIGKWDMEAPENTISTDEYPITTKLGEIKWVMEQSKRLYDEEKNEIGSEGFIIDVTKRKLAEKALEYSEERFRTIFEEAPLGLAVFYSQSGEVCQVNTRYAEITGRTKKELLFTNLKVFLYPQDGETLQQKIDLMTARQLSSFSEYRKIFKPDGTAVWLNATMALFSSEEEGSDQQIICMIDDITDRKKADEEILYLSYYDQLTGLYNRRFYMEELRRIDTERNLPITLVMADVNGLKLTNDTFGHQAGDRLLMSIANIIKKQCRGDDIIARIGGDEFIILLPQTGSSEAEKLVERINAAISEDKSHPVICSVSFGWDTKKRHETEINKIYINAEDRMYRRKLTESPAMRLNTVRLICRTLLQKFKKEKVHWKKVSKLCVKTAKALGMDRNEIKELRLAAFIQNIGYIGLREDLLNKTGGFTESDRTEMERHPEIGYQLLRSVGKYSSIAKYVLYHHERPDGRGYPSKSAADTIPIQSRIIAIADAFDAMTSESTYHEKLSDEEAVQEIMENAGTQFDREIAEVFAGIVLPGRG